MLHPNICKFYFTGIFSTNSDIMYEFINCFKESLFKIFVELKSQSSSTLTRSLPWSNDKQNQTQGARLP